HCTYRFVYVVLDSLLVSYFFRCPRASLDGAFLLPLLFFTAAATPDIYTLSLHDALPISLLFGERVPPISLDFTEHRICVQASFLTSRQKERTLIPGFRIMIQKKKRS